MIYASYASGFIQAFLILAFIFVPFNNAFARHSKALLSLLILAPLTLLSLSILVSLAYAKGDLCFMTLFASFLGSQDEVTYSSHFSAYRLLDLLTALSPDIKPVNLILFLLIAPTVVVYSYTKPKSIRPVSINGLACFVATFAFLTLSTNIQQVLVVPRFSASIGIFSVFFLLKAFFFESRQFGSKLLAICSLSTILVHPLSIIIVAPFVTFCFYPSIAKSVSKLLCFGFSMVTALFLLTSSSSLNALYRGEALDKAPTFEYGYLTPINVALVLLYISVMIAYIKRLRGGALLDTANSPFSELFLNAFVTYMIPVAVASVILASASRYIVFVYPLALIMLVRLYQLGCNPRPYLASLLFVAVMGSSLVSTEISGRPTESYSKGYFGESCPSRIFSIGYFKPLQTLKEASFSYEYLSSFTIRNQ